MKHLHFRCLFLSRSFAYRHWRFPCKRRRVNRTPHRAHLSRATHVIFLVCTWLKFRSPVLDRIFGLCFLRVLKVTPSHTCFTAPCLTHSCLRTSLHRFLHLHLVRPPLLLCCYALADWLNNPVSQVASPNLSSKSAANTLRLTCLQEEAVST